MAYGKAGRRTNEQTDRDDKIAKEEMRERNEKKRARELSHTKAVGRHRRNYFVDNDFDQQLFENHKKLLCMLRTVTTPASIILPEFHDEEQQKKAAAQLNYIYKLMMTIDRLGKIIDKVEVRVAEGEYEDLKTADNVVELKNARKFLKQFED